MKKLVAGLLLVTVFHSNGAVAEGNIWTLDRLNKEGVKKSQVWQNEDRFAENTMTKSQTVTLTQVEEEEEKVTGYNYKEAILTGVKFGATVAGLGVAYLYGPAGLFWGTYYGASYLLKGIGIAGITGAAAATKAGLIVAESSAAKTALVATGGLISNYGAEAAMKGGELALTSIQYAAKGAWSLGTSVYNKFWGSKPVVEEVKPMSREDMRANILRAVEKRTTKTA